MKPVENVQVIKDCKMRESKIKDYETEIRVRVIYLVTEDELPYFRATPYMQFFQRWKFNIITAIVIDSY